MKKEKFLTVFAVFDDITQQYLKSLQNQIFELGYKGNQTMDIPFHISLGSFPVEDENILIEKIKNISKTTSTFEIRLNNINHFGNKVLFVEPEVNDELFSLHNNFANNFADGFPWHAHATLFCGTEEEVNVAKDKTIQTFKPFTAKIVGIQLGEFFPTRIIENCELNGI